MSELQLTVNASELAGRRVLITGGSGFVGAALVHELVKHDVDVHVVLRESAKMWRLESIESKLAIHRADITDRPAIEAAFSQSRPEVVYHLATHGAYEAQSQPDEILNTNITGTLNLLQCSVDHGVGLFVSTGSSSEYGFKTQPMREDNIVEPNSFYAVAKCAQTHLVQHFARAFDLPSVVFRLFSVYGPWEEPTRLIPIIIRRAAAGDTLNMVAPETARDFIFIDDVIDLMVRYADLQVCRGDVFNLGSGHQTTMRDVVQDLSRAVDRDPIVRWNAMPPRHWDSACWVADTDKTQSRFDWSAHTSLYQGLCKTFAWMTARGEAPLGSRVKHMKQEQNHVRTAG